jgi:REP element-mobilizing transposase RayT
MRQREIAIPLAYFITFTTYGTWLHGKETGSVDRTHSTWNTSALPTQSFREKLAQKHLTQPPYILDRAKRGIVLKAFLNECTFRQWELLAAHIRTNHVHIIVHAQIPPERVMSTLKSRASRFLNEAGFDNNSTKRWTHHGSTRYLWKEEQVEATIDYVINQQGEKMEFFENKQREFKTCVV